MKELTAVHERLKGIIDTSVGVAGAMSALRINFSGDESLGADQLDERVKEIAKKTNTSIDAVATVLGPAFSPKGSQSNEFAANSTEAALSVTRDPSQAAALTGAIGDFSKFGESTDPKAILNFLMSSQKSARLLTIDALAKSSTPAVKAVTQTGDSAEVGMEIFTTLANLSADQTGEQTGTVVVNLAAKLEKAGIAGGTTMERIKTLQGDEAARTEFFKSNTFEAKASPAIKAVWSNSLSVSCCIHSESHQTKLSNNSQHGRR